MMSSVVVFSPNPYSLYTIAVVELLLRRGVRVAGIAYVRLINPHRFKSEFRRDGRRLLKKIWRKLVLKRRADRRDSDFHETMARFLKAEGITTTHVREFWQRQRVPVVACWDLNAPEVVALLRNAKPDCVVFTGGGLIRSEVLQLSGRGVINCHYGILPPYRGMDVVEWPLLLKDFQNVGLTVHLMAPGIDTGDIIQVLHTSLATTDTIRSIRLRLEPVMARAIVDASIDFLEGRRPALPQREEEGKQFFIMHPRLQAAAATNLQNYLGSLTTPAEASRP